MESTLVDAALESPVTLDGGLATQLESQGQDLSSALWSARLLVDDPGQIVAAHRRFFAAGAQVAISASYQASFEGLASLGYDWSEAASLMRRSVRLAALARDELDDDRQRWVAASVGPYGAVLADGSEYRGDYGLSVDALRAWHRPRLEALADTGADLLAVETIPCLAEAEALLLELDGLGVPAWLSLNAARGRTRAGEAVEEAFAMAADVDEVVAVGVNCIEAADVAGLVEVAARVSGKPAVAYPNSGEGWDAVDRSWTGGSSFSADLVDEWVDRGARLIGGCCRVGPDDIRDIASSLDPIPRRVG
jgi:homocysteine S-methyltransferase